MSKRRLRGVITSISGDQTATVTVTTSHLHPLYGKRYERQKKFAAHNPGNTFKVGDEIVMEEHRPISKTKRWIILEKRGN